MNIIILSLLSLVVGQDFLARINHEMTTELASVVQTKKRRMGGNGEPLDDERTRRLSQVEIISKYLEQMDNELERLNEELDSVILDFNHTGERQTELHQQIIELSTAMRQGEDADDLHRVLLEISEVTSHSCELITEQTRIVSEIEELKNAISHIEQQYIRILYP